MSNVPIGYSSEDFRISKPTGSNSQMQWIYYCLFFLFSNLKSLGSFNREQNTLHSKATLQSMPNRDCFKYLELSQDTKLTKFIKCIIIWWGKQQPTENRVSFFH